LYPSPAGDRAPAARAHGGEDVGELRLLDDEQACILLLATFEQI
jgi:hypothetical protein